MKAKTKYKEHPERTHWIQRRWRAWKMPEEQQRLRLRRPQHWCRHVCLDEHKGSADNEKMIFKSFFLRNDTYGMFISLNFAFIILLKC